MVLRGNGVDPQSSETAGPGDPVCVCVCVCIRTEVHGLCNIHYACIFVYTALAKKIAYGMKKSLIFDLHTPV